MNTRVLLPNQHQSNTIDIDLRMDTIVSDLKNDQRVDAEQKCQIAIGLAEWMPAYREELLKGTNC